MAKPILVEKRGAFTHVTLNRPRGGNIVTGPMLVQLADIVTEIGRGRNTRGVVLRGAGKDFCHGRDPRPGPGRQPKTTFDVHNMVMSRILGVYAAFRNCPIPIISVVQGKALGFGCALVASSDVALTSEAARFALPEMLRGIPPTLAITALAQVSPKAIADLVYSAEEIDAQTALAVGLVSRVVPADELEPSLDRLLATMQGYDTTTIKVVTRYIATGPRLHPDIASDLAGYTLATVQSRR